MVYEFTGKIKRIKKSEVLIDDALRDCLDDIGDKVGMDMEVRVLTETQPTRDALVKGKASISSYAKLHDDELTKAVDSFKEYLTEIARAAEGEVSKNEGFYNDTKTFNRLW